MNEFSYFCYNDLKNLIPSFPKRHATHTRSGIPCEYYTVPRSIHAQPRGYTNYTYKYDVSESGQIIRIGLRYPRYESNGQTVTETICTFKGNYSDAFLKELFDDFTNPGKNWDLLKSKYPFSNNPSRDSLNLLLPFGTKNKLLPEYPHFVSHLWFVQTMYKKTRMTFCLDCTSGSAKLFDILVGEGNYADFTFRLQKCYQEGILYICTNANRLLFTSLHNAFPNAWFVFDAFQFPIFLNYTAQLLNAYCRDDIYNYRNDILDTFAELFNHNHNNVNEGKIKSYLSEIHDTLIQLLDYKTFSKEFITEIKSFLSDLNNILEDDPMFIERFSVHKNFHSFIPYGIQQFFLEQIASKHKNRGYTPERLAYMLLARAKDLEYGRYPVQTYQRVHVFSMQGSAHYNQIFTMTNLAKKQSILEILFSELISFVS